MAHGIGAPIPSGAGTWPGSGPGPGPGPESGPGPDPGPDGAQNELVAERVKSFAAPRKDATAATKSDRRELGSSRTTGQGQADGSRLASSLASSRTSENGHRRGNSGSVASSRTSLGSRRTNRQGHSRSTSLGRRCTNGRPGKLVSSRTTNARLASADVGRDHDGSP